MLMKLKLKDWPAKEVLGICFSRVIYVSNRILLLNCPNTFEI